MAQIITYDDFEAEFGSKKSDSEGDKILEAIIKSESEFLKNLMGYDVSKSFLDSLSGGGA